MEEGGEQAGRGPKRRGRARQEGQNRVGGLKARQNRWGKKAKEKEKGSRIEGGGRGGRTEDRQMEGTRRDRWEGGEADGERIRGGREGRVGAAGERR